MTNNRLLKARLMARMENVPFSRWHTKARIVMGTATFFDAFDALALAFTLPVLRILWDISLTEIGILISASYFGQVIGAIFFSSFAERFGRTKGATAAVFIMSIMALFCAFAGQFNVLLIMRFIQGIGLGGYMPVAATYINELSPAHGRGRFFLLYEMIFPVGLMVSGQIGAIVVPMFGWQWMFLIGVLPGLIVACLIWFLPESPRWLLEKGHYRKAEDIIEELEASTPKRINPNLEISSIQPPKAKVIAYTSWKELLSTNFRFKTLAIWGLWISAYFTTNGLNNWMPTLYNTFYDLELQQSLRYASFTNIAQVCFLLVCAFVIDKIGRKRWVTASFILGAICLIILGASGASNVTYLLIFGTLSYGIIGSTNSVLYLYTPEVYPTRIRAIGTGLATSWLRLASAVAPTVVGFMATAQGIVAVFFMFASTALMGVVASLFMIETSNKRLEDISQ
tara:strand:- start:97470 stop:98831 length:1362 start_codon:yes stop_codon:yes gene_type:complete